MDIAGILKLSKEMGVEIVDSDSGKHYVIDENGNRVEFDLNMLFSKLK